MLLESTKYKTSKLGSMSYATTVTEISSIADCGSFLATDASAIGTRDYIDRTAHRGTNINF